RPQPEGYSAVSPPMPDREDGSTVPPSRQAPKEELRERTRSVPNGEPVPGLPGGNLSRYRPSVPSGGRESRGEGAAREAHRGQGGRRAPADARGLPEGAHPFGGERAGGPRAALPLRRKLTTYGPLIVVGLAAAVACDQGSQHDQKVTGAP